MQSPSNLQVFPTMHFGALVGAVPPQSTSVSVPFFNPSVEEGGKHSFVPVVSQRTLSQSASLPQPCPVAHFVAQEPPQSVPVSSPFFTMSMQLGARQRFFALHESLTQSTGFLQPLPTAHFVAHVPPQSIPVSDPF